MDIILYSTTANSFKQISTKATTWGELKAEIEKQFPGFVDFSTMTATESINKTALISDLAVLPTVDKMKIFISPRSTKSGLSVSYDKMKFNDIRTALSKIGVKAPNNKADALALLKKQKSANFKAAAPGKCDELMNKLTGVKKIVDEIKVTVDAIAEELPGVQTPNKLSSLRKEAASIVG